MSDRAKEGALRRRPLGKIPEAAERLGMKPSWTHREALKGNLPAVITAMEGRKRSVRIDMDALEEWIEKRRIDKQEGRCSA